MLRISYAITLLAMLFASTADADPYGSLRCSGRIIDVGDSTAEVVSLCGEPSTRVSSQVPVRAGVMSGFTRFVGFSATEQWVYDRGWGKFPAVLHFDNGELRRIDYLPRRSGD
jgi:hypothetical protein